MLTVPAPAPGQLDGAVLRDELAAAGVDVDPDDMVYARDGDGPVLRFPELDEDVRATVEQVVAAHVPPPPPPPPTSREELRSRAESATTVAALRAVLLDVIDRGA